MLEEETGIEFKNITYKYKYVKEEM